MINQYHSDYRHSVHTPMLRLISRYSRPYYHENDPERIPTPEWGDKYVLLGTMIGMVIGGITCGIIGYCVNLHVLMIIMFFIGGAVPGGLIGVISGALIKKRALKKAIEKMKVLNKINDL